MTCACGDAATFAPLLRGLAVARYKGVDLSQAALALPAKKLSILRGHVELIHADILSALSEAGSFDVIYTSFALHHLSIDMKAEAFRRAARRLAANGLLLLVDVVREEDETLPVYYRRYCDWLRRDWTGLDPDLPEPYSVLETQAEAAGLARAPGRRAPWLASAHVLHACRQPKAMTDLVRRVAAAAPADADDVDANQTVSKVARRLVLSSSPAFSPPISTA